MLKLIKEKWNDILENLKQEHDISDVSFKTWLLPLEVHSVEDGLLRILVPEENMGLQYIKKKYYVPLKVSIEEITGLEMEIDFILPYQVTDSKPVPSPNNYNSGIRANSGINLNPRYTFDTFVVGENNNLAHAASLAVSESPGLVYNPLFIYGGVGLGKTHLMHSIAHFILQKNPSAKVLYVTSEAFTNELIEAIRNENQSANTAFRNKYRNIDVLLIDDIQFIIGKESTQQEFFHTFNTLHESKKQIIISSDKPPKEIETLEERLRSRFEWGLTVDIQPPNYETRMAILRKKQELEGLVIDDDVIKYIATNVKSNIRELEGALTKIVAYSKLSTSTIDIAFAETVLKDLISPDDANKEITPSFIIDIVADHFNLTPAILSSKKKNQEIVFPRQLSMYLCRELTDASLSTIGTILGKRDHTTVIHGIEKISRESESNESIQSVLDVLKKKINPS